MTATRVPLKYLARLNPETLTDSTDPALSFDYLDIGATGRGHLREPPDRVVFADSPSRARRVLRGGDSILSTVRTYLRAAWTVPNGMGQLVASTGFLCLRPTAGVDPRYLGWLVQSDVVIEEVVARSVGVSFPAISPEEVGRIEVPCPNEQRQRVIADYLDRETARIDALIVAKRRMLELVAEQYWSWVASQIDQRVESFLPLRRFLTRINDGPFGSALTSNDYSSDGARVVRLGNIGAGFFRADDEAFITLKYFRSLPRHHVSPGDLLIAGLGDANNSVGRACVAPDLGPAIVKADCYCASVDVTRASADFLALYLSSPLGARNVALAARGTTRSRINLDIAREVEVPCLSLAAQDEVTFAANKRNNRKGELSRRLHRQLGLLEEQRNALITVAVTGQLHIPEAA